LKEALPSGQTGCFQTAITVYDPEFWRDYSIIAPEEHITRAISLIEATIERVTGEEECSRGFLKFPS
jgi:hypothetical protein